jgi:hypothetical protein
MIEPRYFGQKPSLPLMMKRGELFFDSLEGAQDEILERSKHIGKIASVAATLAGQKTQHEGDGEAKQLVYAAYLSIGRITDRAVQQVGVDSAENALTSDAAHSTFLETSKTLKSVNFDGTAREFQKFGNWYQLDNNTFTLQENVDFPNKYIGKGCPYAFGNPDKAAYFSRQTDTIVKTYVEAHRRNMPRSSMHRVVNLLMRD